jgi:uncharacterized phage protein gp47/JayE
MAAKTPTQVAQEYLTHLSSLIPDLDTSLQDSDWWVKAQAIGGTVAGIYSDQALLANDPFPQSARAAAIAQHLYTYFTAPNNSLIPAQVASGYLAVTGTVGTALPTSLQATYLPNGNIYVPVSGVTLSATSQLVPFVSVGTGQVQNLLSGASLSISNPPGGLSSNAVASGSFLLGRDTESLQAAAARILSFIQTPPAGGNTSDYQRWALEASPFVVSASVLRYPFGFGTVGVVITAGTTDIDTAINNGQAVVVIPTQDVINTVQAYINAADPITDCATVFGVQTLPVNVSVSAWFSQGNSSTVLPGQSLTQGQLIVNEVMRAIYKTAPGGRQIEGNGYVVKSDIEEQIDAALSNEPFIVGSNPILLDRYVANLSATGPNLLIGGLQQPIPGAITIVSM